MITNRFGADRIFNHKIITKIILAILLLINIFVLSSCDNGSSINKRKSIDETTRLSNDEESSIISSLPTELVVDSIPINGIGDSTSDAEKFRAIYKITNNTDYYINGVPIKMDTGDGSLFLAPGNYAYFTLGYYEDTNLSSIKLSYNYDNQSSDLYGITTEPIREIIYSSDFSTQIMPLETSNNLNKYNLLVTNNTDMHLEIKVNTNFISYYNYNYKNENYKIDGNPLYGETISIDTKKSIQTTLFEYNPSAQTTIQNFQIDLVHFNGGYNKEYTNKE